MTPAGPDSVYPPGMKCDLCGQRVRDGYCSEFCAETSDQEKSTFRGLEPGDFGLWPCTRCGCTIEGEYAPDSVCSGCGDIHHTENLLREATPHLPPELAAKVQRYFSRRD